MRILKTTVIALGFGVGALVAHEGATGIVKVRMDAMSAIATAQQAIKTSLENGDEVDFRSLKGQAAVLNTSMFTLQDAFPEGSLDDISEASPKIWEDPDGFAGEMDKMNAAVQAFSMGVDMQDVDAIESAFEDFHGTCKGCHQDYRLERF